VTREGDLREEMGFGSKTEAPDWGFRRTEGNMFGIICTRWIGALRRAACLALSQGRHVG
jgi:hypothetical protein